MTIAARVPSRPSSSIRPRHRAGRRADHREVGRARQVGHAGVARHAVERRVLGIDGVDRAGEARRRAGCARRSRRRCRRGPTRRSRRPKPARAGDRDGGRSRPLCCVGAQVQPAGAEVVQGDVGRGQRIGRRFDLQCHDGGEAEERPGVAPSQVGDRDQLALLSEQAIGEGGPRAGSGSGRASKRRGSPAACSNIARMSLSRSATGSRPRSGESARRCRGPRPPSPGSTSGR